LFALLMMGGGTTRNM